MASSVRTGEDRKVRVKTSRVRKMFHAFDLRIILTAMYDTGDFAFLTHRLMAV